LRPKHDLVATKVEASDETLGCAVLVDAVEVIATKIDEVDAMLEPVEDRNQDLMSNRHRRLLRAHPGLQAVELVAQVGSLAWDAETAAVTKMAFRKVSPLRVPRGFRFPALSWLAGVNGGDKLCQIAA
jgi:hypothetical protein